MSEADQGTSEDAIGLMLQMTVFGGICCAFVSAMWLGDCDVLQSAAKSVSQGFLVRMRHRFLRLMADVDDKWRRDPAKRRLPVTHPCHKHVVPRVSFVRLASGTVQRTTRWIRDVVHLYR